MTNTPNTDEISGFDKEEPSLCDTCKQAYYLGGGFVFSGGKTYRQRYCGLTNKHGHGRSITGLGYQECEGYVKT